MMERRLKPFFPKPVDFIVIRAANTILDDDFETNLGFKYNSAQHKFFASPDSHRLVMIVHEKEKPTNNLTGPSVIARAFGIYQSGELELWHVSVNKDHRYNDSKRGEHWGHYGLSREIKGSKVRWKEEGGKTLTAKNHVKYVHGTPNPYAISAIYMFAKRLGASSVVQNPRMPCAQLFHSHYDHVTHPATQLIYDTLNFAKSETGSYVWYNNGMKSLEESFLEFMRHITTGSDAVPSLK